MNSQRLHNDRTLRCLEPGDRIQFPRGLYSHWGIFIGDENVAHLAGEDNDGLDANFKAEHVFTICGVMFNKAKVCVDNFWKVAANSKAVKNNDKDSQCPPSDQKTIVARALSKKGYVGYNVITSNCEHFANWCRYGIEKSDQVSTVLTVGALGLATGAAVSAIIGLAKFLKEKDYKEEDEEETAQKS